MTSRTPQPQHYLQAMKVRQARMQQVSTKPRPTIKKPQVHRRGNGRLGPESSR